MNAAQVIIDIKRVVADETGFSEHRPRLAPNQAPTMNAPNAGIYRVVVVGAGKTKQVGLNRYLDLAVVTSAPLSGADLNKSNEQAAIAAESMVEALADYDGEEAQTQEDVECDLIREAGRQIATYEFRVAYKFTEE